MLSLALLIITSALGSFAEEPEPLPEGRTGLAAQYPGDAGIERDPRVIFVERFDEESLDELCARWDEAAERESLSFSKEVPEHAADEHSLLVTHVGGKGSGGKLYRRLLPGHERVFVRSYVRFDEDCAQIHHFGTHLGGFNPPTPWPQGGAGVRPKGDERFCTSVEPCGKEWRWDFYTYWQGMHVHGDGNYWGTPFLVGVERPQVERGRWICVELMVVMNELGEPNGEQAFWIDGKLHRVDGRILSRVGRGYPQGRWMGGWWSPVAEAEGSFDGFAWRSTEELAVNYLWTYVYITKAARGHVSKVWFDQVVVASEYVGPLEPPEKGK